MVQFLVERLMEGALVHRYLRLNGLHGGVLKRAFKHAVGHKGRDCKIFVRHNGERWS